MQRHVLRFGPFELDPGDFTLVRGRARTALQPRTFEVLRYLAENARRIVSREELIAAVWEGVHVTDNTVDQALAKIRKALGDQERILKTVPRRGWRLMVAVKRDARGASEPGARAALPPRLIARDAELAAIADLLAGPHQLVTLLGPGGIGKTALARATLRAWGERARFVDLSPCRTDVDVVAAVADALGVPAQRGAGPLGETLAYAIARSEVALLALDNVEQVAAATGPLVARWAEAAPAVRFLATSRERLGLHNERVLEIGPLSAEGAAHLLRARVEELDVATGQELSDAAALAVAEALERVPLALELAATRLLAEDAEDLVARLGTALLAPAVPTAHPDRQRSMEATIAWSWGLLPAWARDAAEQLSVFRAPFEATLAEEVLDLSTHPSAPAPFQVLGALRSRSLLSRELGADGATRFRTLDAVRAYARGALHARGAARSAHESHARAILGRMAPWDAYRGRTLPARVRRRLRPLVPELQAVLDRALARGDRPTAARAALLVSKHQEAAGLVAPCAQTLARVAEGAPLGDPWVERAAIAHARAVDDVDGAERSLALLEGLAERVAPDLRPWVRLYAIQAHLNVGLPETRDEARALFEASGDDWLRAQAHQAWVAASVRVDADQGLVGHAEESVRLAEQTDDEVLILGAHNTLFEVLHRVPDPAGAEAVLLRAIEIAEAFELPVRVGGMSLNLSVVRSERGNHEGAWEALVRARDIAGRVGDQNLVAFVQLRMAGIRSEQHLDLDGAREHFDRARDLFAALGRLKYAAGALAGRARAAAMLGAPREALDCARASLEVAPTDARIRWRAGLVRAIVALGEGDPAAVHAACREARSALGEGWAHVTAEIDAYEAAACVLEGDLPAACALRDRLGNAARPLPENVRWLQPLVWLVDAATGDEGPARGALAGAPARSDMEESWARGRLAAWWDGRRSPGPASDTSRNNRSAGE